MENMKFKWLSIFLRWSLEALFIIAVIIIVTLPSILKNYFGIYLGLEGNIYPAASNDFYNFIFVLLILSGACSLVILRMLIAIMKSVNNSDPFIRKNVVCLRVISYCCIILFIMFGVKCFIYPTFLTYVITFIFVLAGFLAIVFSELFRQAVEYKSENDLTI